MNGDVACRNTTTPTSTPCGVELVEGVQQRALGGRGVARELGGTVDDLGAPLPRDGGDLGVVGRDDDPVDALRRARGGDGAGDERHAADPPQVLARHALRPAARGDDRDHLAHRSALSVQTRSGRPFPEHAARCLRARGAGSWSCSTRA